MIAKLIVKQFRIKLSLTSVGRLLAQLGFTCQKPLSRAYQMDLEAVQQWKEEIFPQIQKQAKKEGAVIFFQDESEVRSDFYSGNTSVLKGETPIVETEGAKFGLTILGAISPRGEMNFMIIHGSSRSRETCEFLNRLMRGRNQKVFLIWDRHQTHKSKMVKECTASFDGRLRTFSLPLYLPDLNPMGQQSNHLQ